MPSKQRMRKGYARWAALLCMLFLLSGPTTASTFARSAGSAASNAGASLVSIATSVTVSTTSDTADGNATSFNALIASPGADGAISLRESILASNTMTITGGLTIRFNIPLSDSGYNASAGTWTITMGAKALPPLTHGNLLIDGASQPGDLSRPRVVLDGFNVTEEPGLSNGITISSGYNIVRGLTLMNFYDDVVLLSGPQAVHNQITGCYLGPDALGAPASQGSWIGVHVLDGAHDNIIGGDAANERNLISGNLHSGVLIQGTTTQSNIVAGNWIGTTANGRAALKNDVAGVFIGDGARGNTIGGVNQGNVISGNIYGIYLKNAVATVIAGNTIGLAADRRTPLGNFHGGIYMVDGARDSKIGGPNANARNIIAANGSAASEFGQGIYIWNATSVNNTIQGNYIGVDASGTRPAGNYRQGVLIGGGATGNIVGGTTTGAGNVIAYNGLGGIRLDGPSNHVAGNMIGLGSDGAAEIGNQFNGVRVGGANNMIGPNNTIAFNQHSGVLVIGANTAVLSNTIHSNARSGICVAGPGASLRGNVIENNGYGPGPWPDCDIRGGVVIAGTDDTLIINNSILGNNGAGVTVHSGRGNSILANSISANDTAGIQLDQGGNDSLAPPQIPAVVGTTFTGQACGLCRVEIFTDTGDQGRHFLGATTAASDGAFSFRINPDGLQDPHVTATHTDASGNTSQFAQPGRVSGEVPPPTPTPTPPPGKANLFLPIVQR
jgi:hypothetical protein